MKEIRDRLVIA